MGIVGNGQKQKKRENKLCPCFFSSTEVYQGPNGQVILHITTMQRIQNGIDRFFTRPQRAPMGAMGGTTVDQLPFWITYYSNGKPYSIYEPFCTFSTVARVGVVFPPISGSFEIQQCSFRMLNEKEIMTGSGLQDGRMISVEEAERTPAQCSYEIVANSKEELIRQCGHMVPPAMGTWVAGQVIAAIIET